MKCTYTLTYSLNTLFIHILSMTVALPVRFKKILCEERRMNQFRRSCPLIVADLRHQYHNIHSDRNYFFSVQILTMEARNVQKILYFIFLAIIIPLFLKVWKLCLSNSRSVINTENCFQFFKYRLICWQK